MSAGLARLMRTAAQSLILSRPSALLFMRPPSVCCLRATTDRDELVMTAGRVREPRIALVRGRERKISRNLDRDDGQHDVRWPFAIHRDRVDRLDQVRVPADWLARVRVDVQPREVTAGNVQ